MFVFEQSQSHSQYFHFIILGELSRVYNQEELGPILAKYEMVGVAVMALAPCSPILFYGIDFTILGCRITQDNFIGVFLAIASSLCWLLCFFGLHNLTTDPIFEHVKSEILYNSKEEQSINMDNKEGKNNNNNNNNNNNSNNKNNNNNNNNSNKNKDKVELLSIKDILKNKRLILIYAAQVWSSQCYFQSEILLTMYVITIYKFTMLQVGIVSAMALALALTIMFAIRRRVLNRIDNIFFVLIICFIMMSLVVSIFLLANSLDLKQFRIQALFLTITLLMNNCIGFGTVVCNRLLVFWVAPSHSASIVESYRYTIVNCICAISYFSSSLVFSALSYALPTLFVVYYVTLWILVSNRHRFLPKLDNFL